MRWALEYAGAAIILFGGLIGLFGDTRNRSAKKWYRKLTPYGWMTAFIIFAGTGIQLFAINENRRREESAVRPVVAAVHHVARVAGQFLVMDRIARDEKDARSGKAKEIFALEEFQEWKEFACKDLSSAWGDWKGDVDPRARHDVEMLVFYCQSTAKIPPPMFFDNASYVHGRICEFDYLDGYCGPIDPASIERELDAILFKEGDG